MKFKCIKEKKTLIYFWENLILVCLSNLKNIHAYQRSSQLLYLLEEHPNKPEKITLFPNIPVRHIYVKDK